MTILQAIPHVLLMATVTAFGGAACLFRCAARDSLSKRILLLSIAFCLVLQLGSIYGFRPAAPALQCFAALLFVSAQLLFWCALRAHGRNRPAFVFVEVAPSCLTVSGPYRLVRHPIYLSYLLGWTGGALLAGNPWLVITVGWMAFLYYRAACDEERSYMASALAASYAGYKCRVGMFVPRLTWLAAPRQ